MGVLFYGPPGTGKTLTARALARESGAAFLPVSISTMESKWVGESQKIVRALFSLARKLAPTIVFIDEIDVMLTNRGSGTHEHSARVIAEFLSQWDGLTSSSHGVVVIGATNRVSAVDEAILRRMPRKLLFDLPLPDERHKILRTLLSKVAVDEALAAPGCASRGREAALQFLTERTEGYSGADLKELCRFAAMVPMREYVRECRVRQLKASQAEDAEGAAALSGGGLAPRTASVLLDSEYGAAPTRPRLMQLRDLEEALATLRPSAESAGPEGAGEEGLGLLRALAGREGAQGQGGSAVERVDRAELELAMQVLLRAQRYGVNDRK
jgi:SpoVK/Ycf46/Vps4 family AAA+-type ATPase